MVANELRVPEIRSVVGLEVAKLPQKAGYLGDDSEEVIRRGMVVHFEALDSFIVLYNWVKGSLLELLPVPA